MYRNWLKDKMGKTCNQLSPIFHQQKIISSTCTLIAFIYFYAMEHSLNIGYAKYQAIFEEYGIQDLHKIAQAWQETHRYYHSETHLAFLLGEIEKLFQAQKLNQEHYAVMVVAAFFHDIVYDPTRQDNELQSAQVFEQMSSEHLNRALIKEIILDTQHHQGKGVLSKQFSELDMRVVTHSSFEELLVWEKQIFKEYQYLDYSLYREGRIKLLEKFIKEYPQNATHLKFLVAYLGQYRPKIGVYPGSFYPFHNGHLNILEKAEAVFDKVIIAQGINPDKQDTKQNKIESKTLKYRQTEHFQGFLTNYLTSKEKFADITLVRGLRNGDDLDYEVNQLRFMDDMKKDLKVVFLPCDKEYEHISSSSIKNLDKIDPNFSKRYIPE